MSLLQTACLASARAPRRPDEAFRRVCPAYRYYVMSLLGASLAGEKNYAEAQPILLQGYEGLQQRQAGLPPYLDACRRIPESLERLAQLYDAWGKLGPAAEWKQKLAAFHQVKKSGYQKRAQP